MANFVTSIFLPATIPIGQTYFARGGGVEGGGEPRLVLEKANEEAQRLHQGNPDGAPNPMKAIPLNRANWDPKENGLLSEHRQRCILEGLKKGVPK